MKTKKLRIESDFVSGYKKGDVVDIYVDSNDIPTDPFWRQRLKDAQQDNCCELVKVNKKSKKEVGNNDDQHS